jgi:Na+/pantothenate symporter
MKTVGIGLLLGAIVGALVDIATVRPVDTSMLMKVIGLSAAKGAFIAWLIPRSYVSLAASLTVSIIFAVFFWTAVPNRGSFPEDALQWWNVGPGLFLGVVLCLLARAKGQKKA